jgi:hypothetical protein
MYVVLILVNHTIVSEEEYIKVIKVAIEQYKRGRLNARNVKFSLDLKCSNA